MNEEADHELPPQPWSTRYLLLLVAVLAQLLTLIITWPLWNVREQIPHLPVFDFLAPQLPFGWVLAMTLAVIPFRPKLGVWLHFAVMLVACLFDQMRTQPQFLANWILMLATLGHSWKNYTRWFLGSLVVLGRTSQSNLTRMECSARLRHGNSNWLGSCSLVHYRWHHGRCRRNHCRSAGVVETAPWSDRMRDAACRHFDPPLVHHRLELQRIAVEPGNCNHRVLGPLDLRPAFNGSPASCLLRFHHFARRILCRMDGSWILTRVVFWNGS